MRLKMGAATVPPEYASGVWRIDDDDDAQGGLPRWHEADERRVVVRLGIAAVDQLGGSAGLPGDGVAVDLRGLGGAPLDDLPP